MPVVIAREMCLNQFILILECGMREDSLFALQQVSAHRNNVKGRSPSEVYQLSGTLSSRRQVS